MAAKWRHTGFKLNDVDLGQCSGARIDLHFFEPIRDPVVRDAEVLSVDGVPTDAGAMDVPRLLPPTDCTEKKETTSE